MTITGKIVTLALLAGALALAIYLGGEPTIASAWGGAAAALMMSSDKQRARSRK